MESIYNITVKDIKLKEIKLSEFQGKYLLIVNTASKCGLTPQYKDLQSLYEKYKSQGLEILGFPCNQFAGQEPENEEAIITFCELNYNVTFPMFAKIDVNGANTHPLYKFLKEKASGLIGEDIRWNFTKFLVDDKGNVVKRFAPTTTIDSVEKYLIKLLKGK